MKNLFSPATTEGLQGVEVLTCTSYTHPADRNPVSNLESKYQFIRLDLGKRALMLAFDHPLNKGASVFSGVEDVRAKLLSQIPAWKHDVWYIGQPDANRYVYTLTDFDDNGWTTFHDRVPTSSVAHQYDLSFAAIRDLVHSVQRIETKAGATETVA